MSYEQHKRDLQDCYSAQAEHFHHTRKRHRPEMDIITTWLTEYTDTNTLTTILELGCGTGRTFPLLQNIYPQLRYIGNDFAAGMIKQAHQNYGGGIADDPSDNTTSIQRIVADMLTVLRACPDHSVDGIIAIASLQHLMSSKERQLLRHEAYRILRYDGWIVTANWSYSRWFLKKYITPQLRALFASLGTNRQRNDLFIPRKDPQRQDNDKVWDRRYHIYTPYELRQLAAMAGFVIDTSGYICQDGSFSPTNRQQSRNSILLAKKEI